MDAPPAPLSLLTRLRSATADSHQHLEEVVDIASACSHPDSYRRLLLKFLGFHRWMEPVMEELLGGNEFGYRPEERRKSGWIESDLRELGVDLQEVRLEPCAARGEVPELRTVAAAWGGAYVMEGSTLGGRHILSMLEKETWLPMTVRRFFRGYGDLTSAHWKGFIGALEAFGATSGGAAREQVLDGAVATFAALGLWMETAVPA